MYKKVWCFLLDVTSLDLKVPVSYMRNERKLACEQALPERSGRGARELVLRLSGSDVIWRFDIGVTWTRMLHGKANGRLQWFLSGVRPGETTVLREHVPNAVAILKKNVML